MRKFVVLITIGILVLMLPVVVFAGSSTLSFYVNGIKSDEGVSAIFVDRVLYVSGDAIGKELNLKHDRQESGESGILSRGNSRIEYALDDNRAVVNGTGVHLEAPVLKHEEEVYFPLKWLGEQLGFKVLTDGMTEAIYIFNSGTAVVPKEEPGGKQAAAQPGDQVERPVSRVAEENVILFPEEIESRREGYATVRSLQFGADEFRIQLSGPVDMGSFELEGGSSPHLPGRIVIDLPDSQLADSLLDQERRPQGTIAAGDHQYMQSVRYSLFDAESHTLRFVVDLNADSAYRIYQNFQSSEIVLQWTEAAQSRDIVVIDPGHGGKDPGAEGASERLEKEFTLSVSQKIYDRLKDYDNIEPVLTRSDDSFISLEGRAEMANQLDASLFISIHGNTFERPITGTETYYYHEGSLDFANLMHEQVLIGTGLSDRGVRKVKYKVLDQTDMPAVLLELGYLSNPADENKMLTEGFQNHAADAIVAGILNYLENE